MGTILSILLVVSYFLLVLYTWRIAAATKKYAEVTERLLELNKQSSDESRKAFAVNFIEQAINNGVTLVLRRHAPDWLGAYVKAVYKSIEGVDAKLAQDFKSAWLTCTEGEWSEIKGARGQVVKGFEDK